MNRTNRSEMADRGQKIMQSGFVEFLIRAKKATYAGKGAEAAPSRPASHDLIYREGELTYIDTYLGGRRFSGEEAVWRSGVPVWAMNYSGRVTGEPFSGDFLKEALLRVPPEAPYRGPSRFEQGNYVFLCRSEGTPEWFQGNEQILYRGEQVYELRFHGGLVE